MTKNAKRALKNRVGWHLYGLCLVLALLVGGVARWGQSGTLLTTGRNNFETWGVDDAYIAFRYAWNASRGAGLVYDVGRPPVEGYSSLGFVALLIPFSVLGKAGLYVGSIAMGALGLMACVAVCGELASLQLGEWARWPMHLLVAAFPAFWVWAASGLETMVMLALQMALTLGVSRRSRGGSPWLSCLAAAACVVMRADGFVLPTLFVFWLTWRDRRGALALAATTTGVALALVIWRLGYYGWPLPNTVYAKVTGDALVRLRYASIDVLMFLSAGSLVVMVVAAGHAMQNVLDAIRLRSGKALSLESVAMAGWLGYFVLIGGDVFVDRFLMVLVPFGLLRGLALAGDGKRAWRVLAVLLACQWSVITYDYRLRVYADKRNAWMEAGLWLKAASAGRNDLLAVGGAGIMPFLSDLETLDMLGLNDSVIAHEPPKDERVGHAKYDSAYVLGRRPRWVALFEISPGNRDLWLGFDEVTYGQAGYRIRLLGWSESEEPAIDVPLLVDVRGMSLEQVSALMRAGYGLVVLERDEAHD